MPLRLAMIALLSAVSLGCGPHLGSVCAAPDQCGALMCNGYQPSYPIRSCRSAADCGTGVRGRPMVCADYVSDSRSHGPVCVEAGWCVRPESTRP